MAPVECGAERPPTAGGCAKLWSPSPRATLLRGVPIGVVMGVALLVTANEVAWVGAGTEAVVAGVPGADATAGLVGVFRRAAAKFGPRAYSHTHAAETHD